MFPPAQRRPRRQAGEAGDALHDGIGVAAQRRVGQKEQAILAGEERAVREGVGLC